MLEIYNQCVDSTKLIGGLTLEHQDMLDKQNTITHIHLHVVTIT